MLRTRVWLLLAAGCLVAGSAAPPARAGGPPERRATRLLGLSAETSDAGVRIRLHTDGAPGSVAVFALENPRRLVIDLFGLRGAETPARVPVGGPHVSQLRLGRHPEKVRIVADAAEALSSFEPVVTTITDGLVVEVIFHPSVDRLLALPTAAPTQGAREAAGEPMRLPSQPAEEPVSLSGGARLELEAGRRRVGGSPDRGASPGPTLTRTLDLDARGAPSDRGGEAYGGRFDRTPARMGAEGGQGLATLGDFEPGALAHNRIRLGLFDDRIRLTTRHARSRYDAAGSRFSALGSLQGSDLDRLLAPAGVVGEAFSGRLDGTLWRQGPTRIDAFASYQSVDPLFAWSGSDKQDPFARPDRRILETGGVLQSGPLGLALSRISEQTDGDDSRPDRRRRRFGYRAVLSASLDPLRELDAGAEEHVLWSWAPDSAWISVAEGSVEPGVSRPEGATTRDLSAGLSWWGESSSATLGLWRSDYEGEGAALDWSGSGADLGYGLYGERWGLYAGLGAQRSLTDEPGYGSIESSVESFLSLWLRPGHLPGLATTLYLNRYQAEYAASAEPFRMESWGFRTGLDLSEQLFPLQRGRFRPHLRASYGAVWSRTREGRSDGELELDHGPMLDLEFDF